MPSSQNLNLVELNGIRMDPKEIEAILEWPKPTTVIEVKKFSRFSSLLQKSCERFFLNSNTFVKADVSSLIGLTEANNISCCLRNC